MPTKGSTSGQSIEKIREREQARRDARKKQQLSRRSAAIDKMQRIRITGTRTLILVINDRSPANLQICYARLDCLVAHFPKYRYHEHRQRAVMEGRLVLPDLPGELFVAFLRNMTAGSVGWQQGSMEVGNG